MRVALVAIAKDEQLYLDEWIQYHLSIGISHIYLVDNNIASNKSQENICNKYNAVTHISRPYNMTQTGIQIDAYTDLYKKYSMLYDWFMFLDIDEFLHLNNTTLEEFLSSDKFTDFDEILLNWKCFGDSNLVFYDSRPVRARFTIPYENSTRYSQQFPENEIVKPLLRGNVTLIQHEVHTCNIIGKICNEYGIAINKCYRQPISHNYAWIDHYETKTLQEYIERRILNREKAGMNVSTPENKLHRLEIFFNANLHTAQKDKLYTFIKSKL